MDAGKTRVITRHRDFLACTECRRRKLKCNRQTPCTSCVRRGDEASCMYQRSGNRLDLQNERRMRAEVRLEHLEKLVEQVAHQSNGAVLPAETPLVQPQVGAITNTEAPAPISDSLIYNGPSHWSAMLEDIQGLKSAIIGDESTVPSDATYGSEEDVEVNLLLGTAVPSSMQQILAQHLPARQEADRLTAAYFRSKGASAPFIHAAQFRRLYEQFWKEPLSTPILWISILFSIFHVAHNTLSLGKDTLISDDRYSVASAQCLAFGEYFRPKRWAVESLLLFLQAKCLAGLGTTPDIGLLFGVLIRLATSMGYHRDPDIFQFSVFEKEIRRRTWSLCMQLDLLISFQLGLPSNIQFPTWDTRPPSNLQDYDFDEDTKELPPARPDSEPTDVQFYIAKHRLMAVFEKILRHNLTQGTDMSNQVDKLDSELHDVYAGLPEILRPRLMADSVVDPPSLIVTRLCVFFVYQKCLCALHRPYVAQGRGHSALVCYNAASNIVRYYTDIYKHFLPGGLMETERWFMGGITWHDFLLGVMVLCLVLCANNQVVPWFNFKATEALQLLRHARGVCLEYPVRGKDGERVRRIVDATLLYFDNLELQRSGPMDKVDHPPGSLSMESSFTDDLANTQDLEMPKDLPDFPLSQSEVNLWIANGTTNTTEDSSWAYLEHFLNLPDDDNLPDV